MDAYTVYHEYDANGNRVAMTDSVGRWEYDFDALDRVSARSSPTCEEFPWASDAVGVSPLPPPADERRGVTCRQQRDPTDRTGTLTVTDLN